MTPVWLPWHCRKPDSKCLCCKSDLRPQTLYDFHNDDKCDRRSQFFVESFDILVQSTWKSSEQFQWSWWLWCCWPGDATRATVYISADGGDVISVHFISVHVMMMIKMAPPPVMMRPSPVPSVYTRARSTVYLNFRICALVTRSVLPKDEY